MKLSEAIRLGAMLGPQHRVRTRYMLEGRTCAIGAAGQAIGINADFDWNAIKTAWPLLMNGPTTCSVCGHQTINNAWLVAHLNDDHYWTREQIADWVETIEQQHGQPVVAQLEVQPCPIK